MITPLLDETVLDDFDQDIVYFRNIEKEFKFHNINCENNNKTILNSVSNYFKSGDGIIAVIGPPSDKIS